MIIKYEDPNNPAIKKKVDIKSKKELDELVYMVTGASRVSHPSSELVYIADPSYSVFDGNEVTLYYIMVCLHEHYALRHLQTIGEVEFNDFSTLNNHIYRGTRGERFEYILEKAHERSKRIAKINSRIKKVRNI